MIGNAEQIIQYIFNQDKSKKYEIEEYKEKRSKSQNAYMWEIIGKIADVQRLKKEDIYFQMLKDYGQSQIISMLSEINPKGYFKYYEEIGKSNVKKKSFTHYKVYKGSSEFDSREMSILIDGVIQEAKQLDIETIDTKSDSRNEANMKSKRTKACEITKQTRMEVALRDNGRCIICHKAVPVQCSNAHFIKRSQRWFRYKRKYSYIMSRMSL